MSISTQARTVPKHFVHQKFEAGYHFLAETDLFSGPIVAQFATVVREALSSGKPVPVPLVPDAYMRLVPQAEGVYAELLAKRSTDFITAVKFCVSTVAGKGQELWDRLHSETDMVDPDLTFPDSEPWIAESLTWNAMHHLDIVEASTVIELVVACTLACIGSHSD